MKLKRFLGIELGLQNLKFVEIESASKGSFKINSFKTIPIPMLTLPGGEKTKERIVDWEILISDLKEEFKSRNYIQDSVSIVIPEKDVDSMLLTIPPVKTRDIVPLLEREIKKTVTIQEGLDFKISYLKLGERSTKKGRVLDVLTTLAERGKLLDYLNNFLSTGLKPVLFTTKSFSLYSLVVNLYPAIQDAILVSIGYDITSIVIIKARRLQFIRSIYITFGDLVNGMSRDLLIPLKDVESFIAQYGFDFDSYPETEQVKRYKNFITNFLDKFKAELRRSILFYQEKIGTRTNIFKIYLTGEALKIKNIDRVFKERFKLDIEIMPFSNLIPQDLTPQDFRNDYYLYNSSAGVALAPLLEEKINFIPRIEQKGISKKVYLVVFALFFVFYGIICYSYFGYNRRLGALKVQLSMMQNKIQNFPASLRKKYNVVVQKKDKFSALKNTFLEIQKPKLDWEKLFLEFSKTIPQDILVTRFWLGFDAKGNMIFEISGKFRGTFPEVQIALRKLRLSLEETDFFRDTNFDIQRSGEVKIGETRFFNFSLKGHIDNKMLKKREL